MPGIIVNNLPQWVLATALILAFFIEITPVKFSPLTWLGKKINAALFKEIGEIREDIDRVEKKLDQHIADDMRTYILNFQWECLNKEKHTVEEWHRVHKMCGEYEKYVHDNQMTNSEADAAIKYIRRTYEHCLDDGNFIFTEK